MATYHCRFLISVLFYH